jgi:hypothetical protein
MSSSPHDPSRKPDTGSAKSTSSSPPSGSQPNAISASPASSPPSSGSSKSGYEPGTKNHGERSFARQGGSEAPSASGANANRANDSLLEAVSSLATCIELMAREIPKGSSAHLQGVRDELAKARRAAGLSSSSPSSQASGPQAQASNASRSGSTTAPTSSTPSGGSPSSGDRDDESRASRDVSST